MKSKWNVRCTLLIIGNKHNSKKHQWVHTDEKQMKCDMCFIVFRNEQTVKEHQWVHTGEKLFKCEMCWMSFDN